MKLATTAAAVALTCILVSCGTGVADTAGGTTTGGERMAREADIAELERLDQRMIEAWGRDGAAVAATFTEDADFVDVTGTTTAARRSRTR